MANLRKLAYIVAAIAVMFPCAFVAFVVFQTRDEIQATPDNIDAKLQKLADDRTIAGFAVALFTPHDVPYSAGFGFSDVEQQEPYTPQTVQQIASVSKVAIGFALVKAEEEGLIKLEDPIERYLPFAVRNPTHSEALVTLLHLATHTSSLAYNETVVESLYLEPGVAPEPSLAAFMKDYFLQASYGEALYTEKVPGTEWNYSNIGSALAAYVVEKVSGTTFDHFTEQHLFTPLGMTESQWTLPKPSPTASRYYELLQQEGSNKERLTEVSPTGVSLYPARDLVTNVTDLARLGQAILSRDPRLLDSTSYNEWLAPRLSSKVTNRDVDNSGVFLMIDRNQYGVTYSLTGMNGGERAINTMMWLDPVTKMGYIFIGNTGAAPGNRWHHIRAFKTLVSLGDHLVRNDPNRSAIEKAAFRWHNLSSRVGALF